MTRVRLRPVVGAETVLDVEAGTSVMAAAVAHGVSGILADCGGQRQCATCHVYVLEEYADALPPMSEDEDDMLEVAAAPRTARSRLSCQLVASDDIEEIVVELPPRQR